MSGWKNSPSWGPDHKGLGLRDGVRGIRLRQGRCEIWDEVGYECDGDGLATTRWWPQSIWLAFIAAMHGEEIGEQLQNGTGTIRKPAISRVTAHMG